MKRSLVPFILFGLIIIAAGCKTAPEDKTPEPTPVETAKAPDSDAQAAQTENKSETIQNANATVMPSNSEKAEPMNAEAQKAPARTPAQVSAQRGTPQTAAAQSGGASKNKNVAQAKKAPQTKNVEAKPSTQESMKQKKAKSTGAGTSAAKNDASKQSAKTTPQKAPAKEPAQKGTAQKAPAAKTDASKQSASASKNKNETQAKNAPQAKNAQTKPTKQESAQQKTTNSNASDASAAKTDSSKQSAKATPQKAPTKEPAQKGTAQKTTAAKADASKQPAKTAAKKEPAKEPAQKGTAQKTTVAKTDASKQSESASKNKNGVQAKNAPQAKNAQTKPAKQEPAQQKTAKSKAPAENNKKSASPDAAKKEVPKTASTKQNTADKAAPAKQPENKKAEAKTKESATHTAAGQITDILWMIEQADASFVSKQHKGDGKIFVTMFAQYKGDITAQDFQEAFFASPADLWILDEKNAKGLLEINKKDKLLTLKHLAAGEGVGAAALGKWFASVTLAGQKPFEKELNVTGIGGQDVKGSADKTTKEKSKKISFIVPTAKAENEQQALAMPVIRSVSRDADTIEIIFSINDSRVKNAYFYFDVPGEEYYRDSGSMVDATGKPVNGCRSFSTDGKKCQYVLRKDATNKDWFGKATQCFLVVSDVNRMTSPWEERHRTISAASRIR